MKRDHYIERIEIIKIEKGTILSENIIHRMILSLFSNLGSEQLPQINLKNRAIMYIIALFFFIETEVAL